MYLPDKTSCLETLPDPELVILCKGGSDDALAALLARHSTPLFNYCCSLVRTREDAEDVCQETMTRAIVRVDSLESGSSFRSWLLSIAKNLSIDSYRAHRHTAPLLEEEVQPVESQESTPQDAVEKGEDHQSVVTALGRLHDRHRRVLVLREIERLSYAEIAARLEVSESAVETLLFRARRRLREEYHRSEKPSAAIAAATGLRGICLRVASPLLGSPPVAAKLTLTAALMVGTAAAVPSALPKLAQYTFHAPQPLFTHSRLLGDLVGIDQPHQFVAGKMRGSTRINGDVKTGLSLQSISSRVHTAPASTISHPGYKGLTRAGAEVHGVVLPVVNRWHFGPSRNARSTRRSTGVTVAAALPTVVAVVPVAGLGKLHWSEGQPRTVQHSSTTRHAIIDRASARRSNAVRLPLRLAPKAATSTRPPTRSLAQAIRRSTVAASERHALSGPKTGASRKPMHLFRSAITSVPAPKEKTKTVRARPTNSGGRSMTAKPVSAGHTVHASLQARPTTSPQSPTVVSTATPVATQILAAQVTPVPGTNSRSGSSPGRNSVVPGPTSAPASPSASGPISADPSVGTGFPGASIRQKPSP